MSTPQPLDPGTLLPWYLNGTLSPDEREAVESWLVSSSEGQSELLLWRAVQLDTRARPQTDGGPDLGWRRLRTQLPGPVAVPQPVPRATSPWKWAAAASVLMIIGLQSALLLRGPADEVHRPMTSSTPQLDAWRVQVRFAESATLTELQALLSRNDGSIVAGPSALGIYTIAVPREAGSLDELLVRLRAEPLVLQVSVAP